MKPYRYLVISLSTLAFLYYISHENNKMPELRARRDLASTAVEVPVPTNQRPVDEWVRPVGATALELAEDFLRKNKSLLKLRDYHELRPQIMQAPLRTTVRYSVYENGFPVIGMDLSIQTDRYLNLVRVINNYRPLKPSDFSQLDTIGPEAVADRLPIRYRVERRSLQKNEPILFATSTTQQAELSYVIDVVDRAPMGNRTNSPKQIVMRASDGQVLRTSLPRREFSPSASSTDQSNE
ncbi:MAG: hypothetical protein KDD51_01365 [Bdellovibrionales bacterium]|nr:hypothetical protein [Bdellovibrionales bacterium]